jgi:indolepyruvate ferredoxin oxidoreductase, alpha subunit
MQRLWSMRESIWLPAISLRDDKAEIDQTLCYGCGVCETVCPFDAIGEKNNEI